MQNASLTMIEVISLGLNNVGSLRAALQEVARCDVKIVENSDALVGDGVVVIPGTGNFAAGMRELETRGFKEWIVSANSGDNLRILGVCLGMQMLFEESEEAPGVAGLGLLKGKSLLLPTDPACNERVPRVGWAPATPTFPGVNSDAVPSRDVYFSHSYFVQAGEPLENELWSPHCGAKITVGFGNNRIAGFQFHPERSSRFGLQLLREAIDRFNIEN